MSNQLAIYGMQDMQLAASALYKSGYFQDVKSEAQAIVKVMAGNELGLPAFASMAGIYIIQGKPVIGANVIATLVKNDPRYDYRIKVSTDKECTLTWFEHGKPVGGSSFTFAEAQTAGLTGKDNWRKYPSDMLFARAISRGARRFAPGIFGGSPVYTPDELGVDVDEEGYIEAPTITVTQTKAPAFREEQIIEELGYEPDPVQPKAEPKKTERPLNADTLYEMLCKKADTHAGKTATDKQRQFVAALIGNIFEGDNDKRHLTQRFLFGAASANDATDGMILAALDWLKPTKDSGGAYLVDPMAAKECISAYHAAALDEAINNGQQTLPIE